MRWRWRHIWDVLWHGDRKFDDEHDPSNRCPICNRVLTGPSYNGIHAPGMPVWFAPTEHERIVRCPVHGHPPLNTPRKDRWPRRRSTRAQ
jgi:hypothetical protein